MEDPKSSATDLVAEADRARSSFLAYLETLDPDVAQAPIGDDRWAPVQYVEHLVRAEEATVWRMFKAVEDHRRGEVGSTSSTPGDTIEQIVERTWDDRVDAPPLAVPKWGGAIAYWMERMRRNAELLRRFAEMVRVEELDVVAYDHPISGPFTMRQGTEFVRFHIERHHAHVREALDGDG